MKATILHDEHGKIIAVSKIGDLKEAGSKFTKVGMIPGKGQRMLVVELSGEEAKRPILEFHTEYVVDISNSRLAKKDKLYTT
jgi:hypothetical protein